MSRKLIVILFQPCRTSCGHYFCRYCIDLKLHDSKSASGSKIPIQCPICSERIGEIQNCPEINTEIDELFNSLLVADKLDRDAKKAARTKLENALKAQKAAEEKEQASSSKKESRSDPTKASAPNRKISSEKVGRLSSKENIRSEAAAGHSGTVDGANLGDHDQNNVNPVGDAEVDENCATASTSTPLVLHETITIHRTRVIDACSGTPQPEVSCPTSSNQYHQNCGRLGSNQYQHASGSSPNSQNPYYSSGQAQASGPYSYGYYPYTNYNDYCSYYYPSCSNSGQDSSSNNASYGYYSPCGGSTCPASGYSGCNNASASYYTGQGQNTNSGTYGYYSSSNQGHGQNEGQTRAGEVHSYEEEEEDEEDHEAQQGTNFHQVCDPEENDAEYMDGVGYTRQGRGYSHSQCDPVASAATGCNCANCSRRRQSGQGGNSYESDDDPNQAYCQSCGNNEQSYNTYHVSVNMTYRGIGRSNDGHTPPWENPTPYEDADNTPFIMASSNSRRDDEEGLFGRDEVDPEFEEFLETFQTMGLSSPLRDADTGGSANGRFMTNQL